ncbi:MAG: hypothetical protein IPK68_23440 [Bdellovibrionales bacterium]|nr:hypothetical protein [Bdellovibrionales bacterium]
MKESEPFVKLMMKLREDSSSQFELAGRLTDFTDLTKRAGLVSDVAMRVMPERCDASRWLVLLAFSQLQVDRWSPPE